MYSQNGDFGLVKVKTHNFVNKENLFAYQNCGWHKCNDKYRIDRNNSEKGLCFVTISGKGVLEIDDVKYTLTKNMVAYIPRNKKLSYYTPKGGDWEFYWIHPIGEMYEKLFFDIDRRGIYVNKTTNTKMYAEIIERILKFSSNYGIKFDTQISLEISKFLHLLIVDLLDINEEKQTTSEKAMAYFDENKNKNVTVESCAKHLYISAPHLIRVFKKETGITPHKYLSNKKLKEAKTLLSLNALSIKEVALLTGFSSSSHLITAYKNKYGKTPGRESTDSNA